MAVKATSKNLAVAESPAVAKTARESVEALAGAFDWDTVASDTEVVTYSGGAGRRSVNLTEIVPDVVKNDTAASFDNYDPTANGGKGRPQWRARTFATAEMAEAYVKLARRWCRSMDRTFKGGVDPKNSLRVAFAVKPLESRPRKAKADAPADAGVSA